METMNDGKEAPFGTHRGKVMLLKDLLEGLEYQSSGSTELEISLSFMIRARQSLGVRLSACAGRTQTATSMHSRRYRQGLWR